jgi:hypothetical protein
MGVARIGQCVTERCSSGPRKRCTTDMDAPPNHIGGAFGFIEAYFRNASNSLFT